MVAFLLALRLALPALAAGPACPAGPLPWAEVDDEARARRVYTRHFARPRVAAGPMLVAAQHESWWVGFSHRTAELSDDPDTHATGSVAFYVLGPEDRPELDIREADELRLGARLVELRWRDGGRRLRWFNSDLARSLGWLTDHRGHSDEGQRPIPLGQASNTLY